MESAYLHRDIIYQILLKTSNETLAQCRVASEEWNQMTYDFEFKKAYSRKANAVEGFLLHDKFGTRSDCYFASENDEARKLSLDFVPGSNVLIEAVSANSGILLCTSDSPSPDWVRRFFVCKPQLKLCQQIPSPRTKFFSTGIAISVNCSNPFRYKILRISTHRKIVGKYLRLILEVFDSEAWKWKRLEDFTLPGNMCFSRERYPVTASGAFHWLTHGELILSFDIEKEECKTIGLPVLENDYRYQDIFEYEGKLALVCMDREDCLHTWVLQSYINLVWQKKFVINMKNLGVPEGFYCTDVIVVRGPWWLKYYDFKNEKFLTQIKLRGYVAPRYIFPFSSDSEPCRLKPV